MPHLCLSARPQRHARTCSPQTHDRLDPSAISLAAFLPGRDCTEPFAQSLRRPETSRNSRRPVSVFEASVWLIRHTRIPQPLRPPCLPCLNRQSHVYASVTIISRQSLQLRLKCRASGSSYAWQDRCWPRTSRLRLGVLLLREQLKPPTGIAPRPK